jgi:hypothetical protein
VGSVRTLVVALCALAGAARAGSAPTPAEEKFLAEHGFVITGETRKQLFSFYVETEGPLFITTDSLFSGFHTLLEHSVCALEKTNAAELPGFLEDYACEVAAVAKATPALADGAALASRVLLAARFLASSAELPADLRTEVGEACVKEARAAAGGYSQGRSSESTLRASLVSSPLRRVKACTCPRVTHVAMGSSGTAEPSGTSRIR